jgi:HMG-box domain
MSEEWKVMSDADKHHHQLQADRARAQYDKDMKVYKDKVAKAEGAQANDKGDSLLGKKKQKESA